MPESLLEYYKKMLDLAFPNKSRMVNDARIRKLGSQAAKTAAILGFSVSAALLLLALLQDASIVSVLEFAVIFYALLFIVLTGITTQFLFDRLRRRLH
ncbi:MAG: hypothetical protein ACP5OC_00275 [Thermoplasmata archaeon]